MFLLITVFPRMSIRALISVLSRISTYPLAKISNKFPSLMNLALTPPPPYSTEIDGMQGQPVSIATSSITFSKL